MAEALVDALLVVDVQEGLLAGVREHDVPSVAARIAELATRARARGGTVCFIQQAGPAGRPICLRRQRLR